MCYILAIITLKYINKITKTEFFVEGNLWETPPVTSLSGEHVLPNDGIGVGWFGGNK